MESWILHLIRSRCRRRLAVWISILAVAAGLTGLNHRYFYNVLKGPFRLSTGDLGSIANVYDDAPRYFATVHGDRIVDTGIQEITTNKIDGITTSHSISGEYYLLLIGDKVLIVKTPKPPSVDVTGELTSGSTYLVEDLLRAAGGGGAPADVQALRDRIYPFYLDDNSFRESAYIVAGFWILFGFLCWKFAGREWRWLRDPASHPVARRAAAWGDLVVLGAEAEQEGGAADALKAGAGWRVGDKYAVRRAFLTFNICRLADLLWAYPAVAQKRVNFIPIGKNYTIELFFGKEAAGNASIPTTKKRSDGLLQEITRRAPAAISGYSAEREKIFRQNFEEFRAAVAERRRKPA